MYEFTPFKKTEKLLFESFIQFPKELLNREDYKFLSPNAMLLYSILTDRLSLSFKQLECNKKIQFHDAKGNMYVIFKREEIKTYSKKDITNCVTEKNKNYIMRV